ncbi:hypothetical protein Lal_00012018 [Lupinus albus]|uniref:Putative PPC domain-containing protein n=1 Tax=Lupinus albus TaxID=3870 RepID=A0A6A4QCJ7_LUPAL|nr:putative PPC domain-containing protein [Lupinus albus]KAF1877247.1 hypothetical protein Lal_00012018 [Lupinus albus]
MSDYGSPIFFSQLSNSSEDESLNPNGSNHICSVGANGWSNCPQHRPHKRQRGRPPGSKNKPKPPLVITQESEESLKPVIIEIAAGLDVVKVVENFARRRQVCISVISGSGSISNVTIRNPLPHSPPFTFHGPFTLLALTGTCISGPSSSFPSNPNHNFSSNTNTFGISLLGSQGDILGGVIDGKVVAGSNVTIMATMFKKAEYHKVGFNGNDDGGLVEKDHIPNGNNFRGHINMSDMMNPQVASNIEDDVMQWGRIYSSTFSGNY